MELRVDARLADVARGYTNPNTSCPNGARRGGGALARRPWSARTRAMASRVVATSSQRMRPPHEEQTLTSTANTWRNSHAQGFRGWVGSGSLEGKSGSCGALG